MSHGTLDPGSLQRDAETLPAADCPGQEMTRVVLESEKPKLDEDE